MTHAATNISAVKSKRLRSLLRPCTKFCICNPTAERQKRIPKQVTLGVGAILFTAINLLVLAANWSITAHAKVAGMDFSRLKVDTDFRRVVREVVAEMDQSYWRRNIAFRCAVVDVVEGCHLPYRGSTSLRCHAQPF
jgi:hypothetical protein